MTLSNSSTLPPVMQQSRAKLWVRTAILAVFGTLFCASLAWDMAAGKFNWVWALAAWLPCLAIGFWMRRLVPMQVHPTSRRITLSFDRVYFALIVCLVVVKAVTSKVSGLALWADVSMCVILGLMMGRLSGICLRVRDLKLQHKF